MFQGRGAGVFPTASDVVCDIIDTARNLVSGCTGRLGCTCYKSLRIKPIDEIESKYFLRMAVEDRPGVLAGISGVLGNNNVSIAQVVQKHKNQNGKVELVVITDTVRERNFRDALTILGSMSMVNELSSVIRVY